MVRLQFRIGDVFPHDNTVSQFLTGLCMAVNDLTQTMRHMEDHMGRRRGAPEDQPGLNLSYLYRLTTIYREAAALLGKSLDNRQVAVFLTNLSPEGHQHLEAVKASIASWEKSFVKNRVKPIRDAASHYKQMALSDMEPLLKAASDERSCLLLGAGTGTWYEFASAVFKENLLNTVGRSEQELEDFMKELAELVLAFTSFAHEAITIWLDQVDPRVLEITERNGYLGSIRVWVTRTMTRCKRIMSST